MVMLLSCPLECQRSLGSLLFNNLIIDDSNIDEVVVTNTVPHEVQKMQCHKIKTVDISLLISEAIRRIHNQESMSYLFRDITAED